MITKVIFTLVLNIIFAPLISLISFMLCPVGDPAIFRLIYLSLMAVTNATIFLILKKKLQFRYGFLYSYIACAVFIAGYIIVFSLLRYKYEPHGMWDAWTMWNLKSKDTVLSFMDGGSFQFYRSGWGHPGYPLFIPLTLAGIGVLIGGWSLSIPQFYNAILSILLLLLGLDTLRNLRVRRPIYFYLYISLFLPPSLMVNLTDQCADFTIAVFMTALYYMVYLYGNSPEYGRYAEDVAHIAITTSALLLGALLNVKAEGMILYPIMLLFLIYIFRHDLKKFRNGLIFTAINLAGLVSLLMFKIQVPEPTPVQINMADVLFRVTRFERYLYLLKHLGMYEIGSLLLSNVLILTYILMKRYKKDLILLAPLIIIHILYSGIFIVTDQAVNWHLSTAFGRISNQVIPAFFFACLLIVMKNQLKPRTSAI